MVKRRKVKMKLFDKIFTWLVIIGALNWGLVVFNFNLVEKLTSFINFPILSNIIYLAIGFSAVWTAVKILFK